MRFPSAENDSPDFIQRCWPVGSVFTAVVDTDPATLLGFGTWSAIAAGRVLVGKDAGDAAFDALDKTGGAKTHTLSANEMPVHTHTQNAHGHGVTDPTHNHTQNPHSHAVTSVGSAATGAATNLTGASDTSSTTATAANATATNNPASTGLTVNNATAVNQNAGGDAAHNNLQPFLVVRFWKRTA